MRPINRCSARRKADFMNEHHRYAVDTRVTFPLPE
jgi:hypothetical protein